MLLCEPYGWVHGGPEPRHPDPGPRPQTHSPRGTLARIAAISKSGTNRARTANPGRNVLTEGLLARIHCNLKVRHEPAGSDSLARTGAFPPPRGYNAEPHHDRHRQQSPCPVRQHHRFRLPGSPGRREGRTRARGVRVSGGQLQPDERSDVGRRASDLEAFHPVANRTASRPTRARCGGQRARRSLSSS